MSGNEATDNTPRLPPASLSIKQAALIFLLLVVAGAPHYRIISPGQPITSLSDLDGLMKLKGIEADPGLRAALGWFIGDDPQHVHTFRPLPALTLWAEYRLWGWTRWAYQVMNLLYLAATALAVVWVCLVLRMPRLFAVGAGVLMMALPWRGSYAVVGLIATRHDLLCTLFSVLAFGCLLKWLDTGQRRALAAALIWSLLAHLSKEMAIILTPMFAVTALAHRRRRPWRRLVAAAVAPAAVTVVWFAWYHLAERNMGPNPHPSHSFTGMLELFVKRTDSATFFYVASLCQPLALTWRYVFGVASPIMLCSSDFWLNVFRLVVFAAALWLTWRHTRRWLVVLYIWKVFTYLPVLPLSDTWGWYEFMPHVLDPILPVATVWTLWYPLNVPGRLRVWWARRSAQDANT
ncbi:MAG: hypothetical protein J7M38_00710 [Armatimonadetes bacterium]|nr:hypothetical protein [Armatimonadota bacterium]